MGVKIAHEDVWDAMINKRKKKVIKAWNLINNMVVEVEYS